MRDNNQLLLLHLSDIHFREPYCLNQETDCDHPVRKALLNDIGIMIDKLGPVDAILMSGDIAFKGHEYEYETATKWLDNVCKIAKCPKSGIYTVPGNHDVNRVTADGQRVQGARELITGCPSLPIRDQKFHDTLLDAEIGAELFTPMAEYNQFAAAFGCDINPDRPFWIEELELSPGWTLKMRGLTTTFLSGPADDVRGQLYLGALQRAFAPDDGIVRLAIMHHPPDWLFDQDDFDDALWDGCALHLIGHKHRQRYRPGDNGIRLAAGAVNPSRSEGSWQPGYNLIKLKVIHDNNQNLLQLESHLRLWQTSPDRFVAKINDGGGDVFEHRIPLRRPPAPIFTEKAEEEHLSIGGSSMGGVTGSNEAKNDDVSEEVMSKETVGVAATPQRDLVFSFWELTPSQRRKTMQGLDLLEPTDDQLPESQRYRLAFDRARERQLINKLKDAVNQILAKEGGYEHAP